MFDKRQTIRIILPKTQDHRLTHKPNYLTHK